MQVCFDWNENETAVVQLQLWMQVTNKPTQLLWVAVILLRNSKNVYYFGTVLGEAGGGEARLFVSVSPISDTFSQPYNCFTQRDAML